MGVGNHDFDDGPDGLLPFVEECGFPVLGANLGLENFPQLNEYIGNSTIGMCYNWLSTKNIVSLYFWKNFVDLIIVTMADGTLVGIIGYIVKDRSVFSVESIANITLTDEIEAVAAEAKRLKSLGINIIIAAGHAGYEVDKRMAEQVEDLDLVVGGHSHTYLFTEENGKVPPSIERPRGDYPTYVKQYNSGIKIKSLFL